VLFTAAALLVGATSANAQSEIFFSAVYNGGRINWVMGPNGEDRTQMQKGEPSHFKHAGQRWFLVLIPSEYPPSVGGWIHTQLHAVREDGASIQLTFVDGTVYMHDVRWAKDDSKIALLADCYAPDGSYVTRHIYLANVNFTGGIPELTSDLESVVASANLANAGFDLSPDSSQVVYTVGNDVMIKTIGGATVQIMSEAYSPSWSHDGQRIALKSIQHSAVGTVRTDGTGFVKLAANKTIWGIVHDPRWAPDDGAIIFASETQKGRDLYRVSASGGKLKNLTSGMNISSQIIAPVAWRSTINVD
jgi:hypothetical protein